ncbi:MAG: hypothetical protein IT464_08260 [Planctomycetes bacterium]|nr:hypothetical protein [Planctomycetota bacterium]
MTSSNTSRRGKRNTTTKIKKDGPVSKPTVSHTSLKERQALLEICGQIGALIIGQRHDRMNSAVEILQKQSAALLLQQHLDVWLPRFHEHVAALEKVVGKDLKLNDGNLVNDLRTKVNAAGYKSLKEFVVKLVLPVISYHGLLLFLNNEARVSLPPDVRAEVITKMNAINKVLGGACAAMVLQETMGL